MDTQKSSIEALRTHYINNTANHHKLARIFNNATFPSILALNEMISAEHLARKQRPTAAQWQRIFCGFENPGERPMAVCLHAEVTCPAKAQVAFDSFLCLASSSAMAQKVLSCQLIPLVKQIVTADNYPRTGLHYPPDDFEV